MAASRSGTGSKKPTRSQKKPQRKSAGTSRSGTSGSKTAASKSPSASAGGQPGPVIRMLQALIRWIASGWSWVGGLLGSTVRSIGDSATDEDPDLRRDGLALTLITSAIVLIAVSWFNADGPVAGGIDSVVQTVFGSAHWAIPAILLWLAWRTMRHPADNRTTGRLLFGWIAVLIAFSGLRAVAVGSPSPVLGFDAVADGGGILGWAVTAPFVSAVSPILAVMLMLLLLGFGLMILTATPLAELPTRLRSAGASIGDKARQLKPTPPEKMELDEPFVSPVVDRPRDERDQDPGAAASDPTASGGADPSEQDANGGGGAHAHAAS